MKTALIHIYRTDATSCVSPVQTQHFASQRYNISSHDCTDVARNISTNLPNIANNRAMARFFNHQTYKQPQTTLNLAMPILNNTHYPFRTDVARNYKSSEHCEQPCHGAVLINAAGI